MKGIFKDMTVSLLITLVLYVSGFLVIFTPLPILYLCVLRGRKMGVLVSFLAFAIVCATYLLFLPYVPVLKDTVLFGIPLPGLSMAGFLDNAVISAIGIGYFLFFAVIALVLAQGAHKKWQLMKWGGSALVSGLVVAVAVIGVIYAISGAGFLAGFEKYLNTIASELLSAGQSSGQNVAEIEFIRTNASEIIAFMKWLSPSIAFVFTLFVVIINLVVGRRLIRSHHAFAHVHNVARFRLPDVLVWMVIVCGFTFFAEHYYLKTEWLKIPVMNGLISLGALYFFQGLAVVVYFLQGIKMPFFRTLAYMVIIFFIQTIGMAVIAVGVADVWANFRLRSWRAKHTHQA